jgi:hypothetical protein
MLAHMGAKESAVAKSKGPQDESDMSPSDSALLQVLRQKKKIHKSKANYRLTRSKKYHAKKKKSNDDDDDDDNQSCVKCKFNLGDERNCHVVRGKVNNEKGISKFFSPKGDGMLPGDIVWMYVKEIGKKLKYKEGHVIKEGARGFQCKNCKYYLYSRNCLLIEGRFKPKMSCGFIVKTGHGTEV